MRSLAIPVRLILAALLAGCGGTTSTPSSAPAPAVAPARQLGTAPDQFLTGGDVRLRYREIGAGPPVVLLHGYAQRIEFMTPLADSLARDHRVIVLDQRGFGQSSKFSDPVRYGRPFVTDLVALLDRLQIRRAHLVGHSMGAVIAAQAAARYPDRVASVSLVAGPFFADSAAFVAFTRDWSVALERGEGLTSFVKWLFPGIPDSVAAGFSAQTLAQNDLGSLIAVMRATGTLVVAPGERGGIRAPAIIVIGTADPLLPQSREVATWWPRGRLIEVPGENHAAIIGRPELIDAIRALVRSTGDRSAQAPAVRTVLAAASRVP